MHENLKAQATLLENLPLPAMILSAAGQIVAANTRAQGLFGTWITGRDCRLVLREPDLSARIETTLSTQAPQETAFERVEGGVSTRWQVHLRPLPDSDGAITLIFEDTSHLGENALMRRGFVADVSHELRSPLTAISGFIETLQGPAREDPDARARFLDMMMRETRRMDRLVSDLLSLSRLEADERMRPSDRVSPAVIAAGVIETHVAREMHLHLSVETEAMVLGDRDQLTQVLNNLIENAIKYGDTPAGIEVMVTAVDHDVRLRGPAVSISVRDFGPGIPSWHIPRLTERFYRVDDHRSREQGGTGLGLAIVKHIVNRHRGRLVIDSTEGQGSTFSVILPAAPA